MALASCPARQGQQRSLRRILQVLSWAFARSPGDRSLACALLASFWDCGLFFPLCGILAYVIQVHPVLAVLAGVLRERDRRAAGRRAPKLRKAVRDAKKAGHA